MQNSFILCIHIESHQIEVNSLHVSIVNSIHSQYRRRISLFMYKFPPRYEEAISQTWYTISKHKSCAHSICIASLNEDYTRHYNQFACLICELNLIFSRKSLSFTHWNCWVRTERIRCISNSFKMIRLSSDIWISYEIKCTRNTKSTLSC